MDALRDRSFKLDSGRYGLLDEPMSSIISADNPGIIIVGRVLREFAAFGLIEVAEQDSAPGRANGTMAWCTKCPAGEAGWGVRYGCGQHRDLHIEPDLVRFEGSKVHPGKVLKVHEASNRLPDCHYHTNPQEAI
jgi:hypothetical protein